MDRWAAGHRASRGPVKVGIPDGSSGSTGRLLSPASQHQHQPRSRPWPAILSLVVLAVLLIALDISHLGPSFLFKHGSGHQHLPPRHAHLAADVGSEDTKTVAVPDVTVAGDASTKPSNQDKDPSSVSSEPAAATCPPSNPSCTFRDAPWQAAVYHWLADCWAKHLAAPPTPVPEKLFGLSCPGSCQGRGVCNHETGQCRCHMGYKGPECAEDDVYECNKEPAPEFPLGPWGVSICPASCDKRTAHCLCGEGTRFPDRSLVEPCGFTFNPVTHAPHHGRVSNSTLFDPAEGYCNVDAAAGAGGDLWGKYEGCYQCVDGQTGLVCHERKQPYCANQCSGHGTCRVGFCECEDGFYHHDCSTPSALTPPPLAQASPLLQGEAQGQPPPQGPEGDTYLVPRRRPLIYIYDLPPEFTVHHLEGRSYAGHCVPWTYDIQNNTEYNGWLYTMETAIIGSLMSSPHRTLNAAEADYFLVPLFGSCITVRADDSPRMNMERDFLLRRSYFTAAYYQRALEHIQGGYPHWARHGGRDHIWIWAWDEGACWAPESTWPSILLSHWGNTGAKHARSTTAYGRDSWDEIPRALRGTHPCFEPSKDIVMPAYKSPAPDFLPTQHRGLEQKTRLFYFNGNLGAAYQGRPEPQYSMGIRQKVAHFFASSTSGPPGVRAAADVVVTAERAGSYGAELASSKFCGVFPGDGFSARMEDAVLHGCIPVIIQDGIQLPFENFLNYERFAVRIAEEDIPSMVDILRAMPDEQVADMLQAVLGLASRWYYRSFVALEAQRQQAQGRAVSAETEATLSVFKGDDAVDTLIQALAFKLENDPWRQAEHKHRICVS